MRFFIALLIGKLIYALGKPFGKSTNLPGEIALKICPDLFKRFSFKGTVLAVTGSNGKTTTANLVAHILKESGHTVTNNAKGSNLTGGVATTLLHSSNFKGIVPEDFVVLEVDERFSRLIFKDFGPKIMLVTNLFRDQLTRNGNVDVIISKLHEAIKPDTKLILNANDPISSNLAPSNERVYYYMERTPSSTDESLNITHDAKVCPICFGTMKYDFFHYNHVGKWQCTNCGYKNADAKYIASDVNVETGDFKINGKETSIDYKPLYNFLNTTAAIALCTEAGIDFDTAVEKAQTFKVSKQRYDEFDIGNRKAVMILSKNQNPVSFDQSVSYVLNQPGDKTVIVYVNNINHTNNKDTTWLYDISFNRFDGQIDTLVCTGPRAVDLAVRLKLSGYDMSHVIYETELSKLKPVVAGTKGTIYVLTELYDATTIVNAIKEA